MPAFNYQQRFVPFLRDGSKWHTIRSRRKCPVKPGDTLYHYTGMRTKQATLIAKDLCLDVKTIVIGSAGRVWLFCRRLTDSEAEQLLATEEVTATGAEFDILDQAEKDQLAWVDGFRPEGSSLEHPTGCFDLMFRWWNTTHELPFVGDIIYRSGAPCEP
jgi:hypothetical protein